MGVSYTKAQRELAKREGLHLVTLAAKGIEVQAPVSKAEMDLVAAFIVDFLKRRSEWLKKPKEAAP